MIDIFQVDAFTNEPFKGNPAAVCLLHGPGDDIWMQNVAAEMNLSETAFIYPHQDGYYLRWFTPIAEVDLCGHATLASAHILWEKGRLEPEKQAKFYCKSGILTAVQRNNWIELDFPSEPEETSDCPIELLEGLGIKPIYVGRNRFDYLVEVESEEILKGIMPNWSILEKLQTRGVIVTASSHTYDFISRAFFPAIGVNEDPVTGSTHCCLGPYWQKKLNKNEFTAYQASKRGGIIKVKIAGNRVLLSGQAITVMKGAIM